ncbi:MAG: hypothetical protein EBX37_15135 [Alphaproteobacteria bacterium]|nr:hypothetical protein [Alphaproteobacteria bacterium]
MIDSMSEGFGKFVPGFDFLQNLAKGASQTVPQMPNLANWVAPTLNVEELDKRISELKAVHFWLDQNSKALGATVQALEVQKMTLATLKGMNFNLGEVANTLAARSAEAAAAGAQRAEDKAAAEARSAAQAKAAGAEAAAPKPGKSSAKKAAPAAAGLVDPLQLWSSLTQQFQQIAATAMTDATKNTALNPSNASQNIAKKPAVSRAKAPKAAKKTPVRGR